MHFKEVKGILSPKNGMNIYRGCTHGCIYCDSRSHCYQMQHDFEDVEVKANAPALLDDALRRRRNPCMVGTGAMSDPYIHAEGELRHTRRCLEVIARHGCGLSIQTKSTRLLEDLPLLSRIHDRAKCVVQVTLTTCDEDLCRIVEPAVSTTAERFAMLETLRDAGIPTVVWLTPFLPYLNDTRENIEGLLGYCIRAGVKGVIFFGVGMTLREGNREYYYQNLDRHFPGLSARYRREYGNAYELISPNHGKLAPLVYDTCRKAGILWDSGQVFAYLHTYESRYQGEQLHLF